MRKNHSWWTTSNAASAAANPSGSTGQMAGTNSTQPWIQHMSGHRGTLHRSNTPDDAMHIQGEGEQHAAYSTTPLQQHRASLAASQCDADAAAAAAARLHDVSEQQHKQEQSPAAFNSNGNPCSSANPAEVDQQEEWQVIEDVRGYSPTVQVTPEEFDDILTVMEALSVARRSLAKRLDHPPRHLAARAAAAATAATAVAAVAADAAKGEQMDPQNPDGARSAAAAAAAVAADQEMQQLLQEMLLVPDASKPGTWLQKGSVAADGKQQGADSTPHLQAQAIPVDAASRAELARQSVPRLDLSAILGKDESPTNGASTTDSSSRDGLLPVPGIKCGVLRPLRERFSSDSLGTVSSAGPSGGGRFGRSRLHLDSRTSQAGAGAAAPSTPDKRMLSGTMGLQLPDFSSSTTSNSTVSQGGSSLSKPVTRQQHQQQSLRHEQECEGGCQQQQQQRSHLEPPLLPPPQKHQQQRPQPQGGHPAREAPRLPLALQQQMGGVPAASAANHAVSLTPRNIITSAAHLSAGALRAAAQPLTPRGYLQQLQDNVAQMESGLLTLLHSQKIPSSAAASLMSSFIGLMGTAQAVQKEQLQQSRQSQRHEQQHTAVVETSMQYGCTALDVEAVDDNGCIDAQRRSTGQPFFDGMAVVRAFARHGDLSGASNESMTAQTQVQSAQPAVGQTERGQADSVAGLPAGSMTDGLDACRLNTMQPRDAWSIGDPVNQAMPTSSCAGSSTISSTRCLASEGGAASATVLHTWVSAVAADDASTSQHDLPRSGIPCSEAGMGLNSAAEQQGRDPAASTCGALSAAPGRLQHMQQLQNVAPDQQLQQQQQQSILKENETCAAAEDPQHPHKGQARPHNQVRTTCQAVSATAARLSSGSTQPPEHTPCAAAVAAELWGVAFNAETHDAQLPHGSITHPGADVGAQGQQSSAIQDAPTTAAETAPEETEQGRYAARLVHVSQLIPMLPLSCSPQHPQAPAQVPGTGPDDGNNKQQEAAACGNEAAPVLNRGNRLQQLVDKLMLLQQQNLTGEQQQGQLSPQQEGVQQQETQLGAACRGVLHNGSSLNSSSNHHAADNACSSVTVGMAGKRLPQPHNHGPASRHTDSQGCDDSQAHGVAEPCGPAGSVAGAVQYRAARCGNLRTAWDGGCAVSTYGLDPEPGQLRELSKPWCQDVLSPAESQHGWLTDNELQGAAARAAARAAAKSSCNMPPAASQAQVQRHDVLEEAERARQTSCMEDADSNRLASHTNGHHQRNGTGTRRAEPGVCSGYSSGLSPLPAASGGCAAAAMDASCSSNSCIHAVDSPSTGCSNRVHTTKGPSAQQVAVERVPNSITALRRLELQQILRMLAEQQIMRSRSPKLAATQHHCSRLAAARQRQKLYSPGHAADACVMMQTGANDSGLDMADSAYEPHLQPSRGLIKAEGSSCSALEKPASTTGMQAGPYSGQQAGVTRQRSQPGTARQGGTFLPAHRPPSPQLVPAQTHSARMARGSSTRPGSRVCSSSQRDSVIAAALQRLSTSNSLMQGRPCGGDRLAHASDASDSVAAQPLKARRRSQSSVRADRSVRY